VDGLYCGQSPQWGGGQKDVLYDCQGGVTKSKTTCAYGCFMAPPNVNDSCNPAPADAGGAGDGAASSDGQAASGDGSAAHDGGGVTPPPPGVDAGDSDASWDNGSAAPTGGGGGCAVSAGGHDDTGALVWLLAALGVFTLRRRHEK
jgi:MYXO-CTERM domain-containing protein